MWFVSFYVRSLSTSLIALGIAAAVEILGAVRGCVPDWVEILTTMVDAVAACPGEFGLGARLWSRS